MKYSLSWISDFVDIKKHSAQDIADSLTVHSCEVEEVIKPVEFPAKVVVGKILKISAHPDADRIRVCKVEVGEKEPLTIICGGSNLEENQIVPVALVGAVLDGEFKIDKRTMRGVESVGMICAKEELGFEAEGDKKIWDMNDMNLTEKIGKELRDILPAGDTVIDVDNKSITNRPDLFSHIGIAREISALFDEKLKAPKLSKLKLDSEPIQVEIEDTEACHRYCALKVSGIKIDPSPEWMQQRLIAIGLRPINNIVDITNYVMYELGEPMHAFDAEHLKTKDNKIKINVRKAKEGENIKLLDETIVELDKQTLVIANDKEPLAIAGIMGGENSGVVDSTTEIVFEAAAFSAVNIRRTQSKFGVRTDSSIRFEKFLDPNLTIQAISRAAELTLQLCPKAKISSELCDIKNYKDEEVKINISVEEIQRKIGAKIDKKQIIKILEALEFKVSAQQVNSKSNKHREATQQSNLKITVPSFRAARDIDIKEDIVEEISRIYGYDKIPLNNPCVPLDTPRVNLERVFTRKLKNFFANNEGFSETYVYPFISRELLKNSLIKDENITDIANPLSSELEKLSPSLLPNLLIQTKDNLRNFEELSLFVVDRTWLANKEHKIIAGIMTGKDISFYKTKGVIENMLTYFQIQNSKFQIPNSPSAPYFHPSISSDILVNKKKIGTFGEIHPQVLKNFDIDKTIYYFEMDIEALYKLPKPEIKVEPIPLYPEVKRDIAFIIDKKTEIQKIISKIQLLDTRIAKTEIFDIYEGDNIAQDKKSIAIHLHYRDPEKTLSDKDAEQIHESILKTIQSLGGEIRA